MGYIESICIHHKLMAKVDRHEIWISNKLKNDRLIIRRTTEWIMGKRINASLIFISYLRSRQSWLSHHCLHGLCVDFPTPSDMSDPNIIQYPYAVNFKICSKCQFHTCWCLISKQVMKIVKILAFDKIIWTKILLYLFIPYPLALFHFSHHRCQIWLNMLVFHH